jgi:hypothetical protein
MKPATPEPEKRNSYSATGRVGWVITLRMGVRMLHETRTSASNTDLSVQKEHFLGGVFSWEPRGPGVPGVITPGAALLLCQRSLWRRGVLEHRDGP